MANRIPEIQAGTRSLELKEKSLNKKQGKNPAVSRSVYKNCQVTTEARHFKKPLENISALAGHSIATTKKRPYDLVERTYEE